MRASPPGLPTDSLPLSAIAAAEHFRDALLTILGDDLVALWVDGGTTFEDRPLVKGDLDVAIVVANLTDRERDPNVWQHDPGSRPARVVAAQQSVEHEHSCNIDANYLALDEVGGHDLETMVELWTDPDVARFMDEFGPRARAEVERWLPEARWSRCRCGRGTPRCRRRNRRGGRR